MALFEKTIATTEYPELTFTMAQAIYAEFKLHKDCTTQFTENGTYIYHSTLVWNEIKKLEKEIISYVISDEYPHSKEELIALLSSDLLDITIIVDDCILYNPTYVDGMTFTEFVNAYRNQDIV